MYITDCVIMYITDCVIMYITDCVIMYITDCVIDPIQLLSVAVEENKKLFEPRYSIISVIYC